VGLILKVRRRNDHPLFQNLFSDQNRIEQIFTNFISNAIKFSKQKRSVLVLLDVLELTPLVNKERLESLALRPSSDCELEDHEMLVYIKMAIEFRDTGLGISEEGLKNLFLNFNCLQENSKANTRGTGLGLSICKQIIERMGGDVTVTSKLGEGTTFRVQIVSVAKIDKATFHKHNFKS
jgi:signal transduction histidine kinase